MKPQLISLILLLQFTLAVSYSHAQQAVYHIAFSSSVDGNDEILVAREDASTAFNVTQNTARDWHPTWSPDGTKIAFTSDRNGTADIWIMDSNGLNPTLLSSSPGNDSAPDWSSNGTDIVFVSDRDGGPDLYSVDANTGDTTRLTTDQGSKSAPAWSADGTRVAYAQVNGDNTEIRILEVATGDIFLLIGEGNNNWPVWTPDDQQIFIHREDPSTGTLEVYAVGATGGTPQRITWAGSNAVTPALSADGSRLAYASNRNSESYDLFVSLINGDFPRRLISFQGNDLSPAWQPIPAQIPQRQDSVVVQQSVTVSTIATPGPNTRNEVIEGMTADLIAPQTVGYQDLIVVRLEVTLDDPESVAPGPTPTPNPDTAATLRERVYIENSYRYVGARLMGLDLNRFDVSLLKIDEH